LNKTINQILKEELFNLEEKIRLKKSLYRNETNMTITS